ncbi:hypothetical protein [Streptomyces sp. TS71-3]|uniref:hypothetical protein n=1 Tax=Streptomyces sp. TS71-3 TaxID=2733862 RepID=UPI001B0FA2A1|nr:hypothetical protein [Streptomyces sp. TS71-3]GHJ38620.1 hypothetical protein Sm713_42290 [Streptomyces sp. TS71-3]
MRRMNARKTPVRPGARRMDDEAEEREQQRPEVRRDIRRIWWPESDEQSTPRAGTRGR